MITLKLAKRDIPDITKDQIWDHLEEMPDFKEIILSQENIKLLGRENTLEDENGKVDPVITTRFLQVNADGIKYERLTNP